MTPNFPNFPYVLATRNAAKIAEFADITEHFAPHWYLLPPEGEEPVENGTSFVENALIKARAAHQQTGLTVLADDSGICVDVLGGAPGIFSAYWSGRSKNLTANRTLLLEQLFDIQDPARTAHFRSALALIEPDGTEHVAEATWHGRIAHAPEGDDGFPYDSVFIPDTDSTGALQQRTVAQWSPISRHLASHRANAFHSLLPVLHRLEAQNAATHSTALVARGRGKGVLRGVRSARFNG